MRSEEKDSDDRRAGLLTGARCFAEIYFTCRGLSLKHAGDNFHVSPSSALHFFNAPTHR